MNWTVRKNFPAGPYGVMLDASVLAPSGLAPAPDRLLATVTLHNESASVQDANFVSPMFGAPFKRGDIPSGSFPVFKVGATVCPATLHSITSWPDGSMKFCGVILQVPVSIAATSTLGVEIRSGGTAPAAGTRTTADLTGANILVELVGVDGLTGVWTSTLNDAITAGDDVVKIADGPAGAIWRIGGDFKDTGNAAHGQLYCWHYVAALSNSNGTLRGLRYLGRPTQPWIDAVALGAPEARHRDVTMSLRTGSTTIRNCTGYAADETTSSTIRILHNASVFTAGQDGKWDYIQGSGSVAADTAVRVSIDIPYLISTQLVPPYNLTTVVDPHANVNYLPNGKGACENRYAPGTGERAEIGLLPAWAARHILRQDASHEKATRVTSLIGGGWRYSLYNSGVKKIAPFAATRASFPTLGPIRSTWRGGLSHMTGLDIPTVNDSLWTEDQGHQPSAHYWAYLFSGEPQTLDMQSELAAKSISRSSPATRTYDLSAPILSSTIMPVEGERNTRIGTKPARQGAVSFLISNGMREGGWALRDLVEAVAILPDTMADGTELKVYFKDCVDNNLSGLLDYRDSLPAAMRNSGLFQFEQRGTRFEGSSAPWHKAFFDWALIHTSRILPSANANAVLAHISKYYESRAAAADIGFLYCYRDLCWAGPTLVNNDMVAYQSVTTINFVASTGRGTVLANREDAPLVNGNRWMTWVPTNGDNLVFGVEESSGLPNPTMFFGERVYLVNVSGNSFQISRTPGGTPLEIPEDITISSCFMRSKAISPSPTYGSNALQYSNIIHSVLVQLKPGHPNVDAAYARHMDYMTSFRSKGLSFKNQPKYCLVDA